MELKQREENIMDLSSELTGRRDDDAGDVMLLCRFVEAQDSLEERNEERKRLAATGNSLELNLSVRIFRLY